MVMGRKAEITYEEGIMVGYRYCNTMNIPTAYPFSFGLSYTTFTSENIKLSSDKFNEEITVKIDIKNFGNVAGKEVVQLYLSAPSNSMTKPTMELKRFSKTKLLEAGENKTLEFTIRARDFVSFYAVYSAWVPEVGNYTVKSGASSENIQLG